MTEDELFMGSALNSLNLEKDDLELLCLAITDLYMKHLREVVGVDTSNYPQQEIVIGGYTYMATMLPVETLEGFPRWFRTMFWPGLMKDFTKYTKDKSKEMKPLEDVLDKYRYNSKDEK